MNRFAFLSTAYTIKWLHSLSKTNIILSGHEQIPDGSVVFVGNHFTRIETVFLPINIHRLTGRPVWSLADHSLFYGVMEGFLEKAGAVSTRDPHRDHLVVNSLLTGAASWVIFPEGRMVKNKEIHSGEGYTVGSEEGARKPHTGAANMALRAEFYRQRLRTMVNSSPAEARRLMDLFQIESPADVNKRGTYIVPVNITYFPIRAKENAFSQLAERFVNDLSARAMDEIMTEGTMLLEGVDVDIRFGSPIPIEPYLDVPEIRKDMTSTRPYEFDDPLSCLPQMKVAAESLMNRFMADIYAMTTVNHDHLFASILKKMPETTIDEQDLRNRVYLAATLNLDPGEMFLHKSLRENQVHLLTDDRYHHYEDFIKLAESSGIVTRVDGKIIKNSDIFIDKPDFHSIRVENPVSVMANEIEPLKVLQAHLTRLALDTPLNIKRRVIAHLTEKGAKLFDQEYQMLGGAGDKAPAEQPGRPFLMRGGADKSLGVVLVHGYLGMPAEVRSLAHFLKSHGYWVYAPRLPGHGTDPSCLAKSRHQQWVDTVEEGVCLMRHLCAEVVVGGLSLGGNLAMELASRLPEVAGVFAFAPAYSFGDYSTRLVPAVGVWKKLMAHMKREKGRDELLVVSLESSDFTYTKNPAGSLRELEQFLERLSGRLDRVRVPALVVQSLGDPIVRHSGALDVYEKIGARDKEFRMFDLRRHDTLNGYGSGMIKQAVLLFLNRLRDRLAGLSNESVVPD